MDGHDFTDSDSLPYVCMASLSLAAKFDCKETRVPKYRQVPLVQAKGLEWLFYMKGLDLSLAAQEIRKI